MSWTVTYSTFYKPKKKIRRHFPNERKARSFYRSLWKRDEPPMEQSIQPKK